MTCGRRPPSGGDLTPYDQRQGEDCQAFPSAPRCPSLCGFRAGNPERTKCLAAQFLLEELEAGKDLDSIFFMGSDFGYELSAREIASNLFKIGFGCIAGPTEGHGGQWEVEFNPDDSIAWIDSLET